MADDSIITHVIFDLDGLLLDTEVIYSQVTQKFVARYGKTFEPAVKVKMMGKKLPDAMEVLIDTLQLPVTVKDALVDMENDLHECFPSAKLMPGAEKLIRHLQSKNIPIAVATGSDLKSYNLKTCNHKELFGLFSHVVTADDKEVKHCKPAPDIFLICASRFLQPPVSSNNVLVFEDAPNGIMAARSAGMKAVMVPEKSYYTDRSLWENANVVLDTLEKFNPNVFGLPS